MRLGKNSDGLPVTLPIETPQEAIEEIDALFQMSGYKESDGDLWLGNSLDRLRTYLEALAQPLKCEHANADQYFSKCPDCGADISKLQDIIGCNACGHALCICGDGFPDLLLAIIRELAGEPFLDASVEGGGAACPHISLSHNGKIYMAGDASQTWMIDEYLSMQEMEDGKGPIDHDLKIPTTSTDAKAIADAIRKVVLQ